jgi:hypothetical protein
VKRRKQALAETPGTLNLPEAKPSPSGEVAREEKFPAAATSPEVNDALVKDPAWEGIRQTIAAVRAAGRAYLFGQAWLGWQLAVLKKEHGAAGSGRRKESRQLGDFKSWKDIVLAETGLSDRTADRFIQLFDATQAKLKRKKKGVPANPNALALFKSENPLALPPEQREALQDVIASLCDGETQASLMQELGVVPKPALPPGGPKKRGEEKYSMEQLAFDFFEGPASAIMSARSNKDYKKLLYVLPAVTDQEGQVSLVMLRDEVASMLEDVNEALAAHAKPAKGKTAKV